MHKLGGRGCFYFFGQKLTVKCRNKELIRAALSKTTQVPGEKCLLFLYGPRSESANTY